MMTTFSAGCLVLAGLLALPPVAQDSQREQPNTAFASGEQKSEAYHQGYWEGLRDRDRNFEPSSGHASWSNAADRRAYRDGYRLGYCKDEGSRTGYYNGVYHDYGPPVIRNGYYGYNAPSEFCQDTGAASRPGDDSQEPKPR
jgi:hypothetical protein